ncbi:MAG: hypothetical protein E6Q38_00615 [Crocinitomicaceae bacterium]|nr:MAG: hypothetical protein E6Q38_00615 [Crocinitomicaceae bacterium]
MRVNLKYFQLLTDAIIPLLGYFLWHWNLYFIVLFYLLDYLAYEVFSHIKANKVQTTLKREQSIAWLKLGIVSALLFIVNCVLVQLTMKAIVPTIDFTKELSAFWNYKDMGIEQGYFLLPLIAFAGYQRYKMEFLMTGLVQKISIHQIFTKHIQAQLIAFGFIAFTFGLSFLIVFPEIVYVLGIVLFTGLYQFFRK